MEHETTTLCTWCHSKLGKGSVLFTTAFSERGRKQPMCIKCAVWSLTGSQPPYVPTDSEPPPVRGSREQPQMRRSA